MLKVVFDTQIFLRGLINPSSGSGRLIGVWTGYYVLYVTDAIEAELVDVLSRPHIRSKFPQITRERVETTLALFTKARRIEVTEVEAVSRDPKDDMFLACAKAAQADYLVSEDKDLLVLNEYAGTQIVNVLAFLSALENLLDNPSHE